jgi:hypothetical protein
MTPRCLDQVFNSRPSVAVEREAVAVRGDICAVDDRMALNVVEQCTQVLRCAPRQACDVLRQAVPSASARLPRRRPSRLR